MLMRRLANLSLLFLLTACGYAQEVRPLQSTGDGDPTSTPPEDCVSDYPFTSFNEFVHDSDLAAIVAVEAVSAPTWSSYDGVKRGGDEAGFPPYLFREVNGRVERVLWSSDSTAFERGEQITVTATGDGSSTGCSTNVGGRENELTGRLEPGGRNLLLLKLTEAPFFGENGMEQRSFLGIKAWGNWSIQDGQMDHLLPARRGTESDVVADLMRERTKGRDPNSREGLS